MRLPSLINRLLILVFFIVNLSCCTTNVNSLEDEKSPEADRLNNYTDWGIYRGDKKSNQYADIAQIHAANVHKLAPVWEYHTGDAGEGTSMYSNPIVIDGTMYFTTPSLNAVALDATTGKEVWVFKSSEYNKEQKVLQGRNRGVTYWEGKAGKRVFLFAKDRVYAIDATSGELIESFGEGGHINLLKNLGIDEHNAYVEVTTPGIIYKNLLIIGSRVSEDYDSSPGHVRAYHTVSGELEWIFHAIPKEGEFGYDTWEWVDGETYGGANPWGGFSIDEERGWVFFATGSPANDFYGGFRKGTNLFGNCVIALDAGTGERQWHYQTVHHDIYDYDNPPAPILVTLELDGQRKDAVVQMTKMGLTFILDREIGKPLFPVEERPIPVSKVPGEESWVTQPFPKIPSPLVRQTLTMADLSSVTPESKSYALEQASKYDLGGVYTPPSLKGTISLPGHQGGVEWGGGAYDPFLNRLYVNANEVPSINRLLAVDGDLSGRDMTPIQLGQTLYQKNCGICHGADMKGAPPAYPPLLNLKANDQEIRSLISQGKNLMPAFSQLSNKEVDALVIFLKSEKDTAIIMSGTDDEQVRTDLKRRYVIDGYRYLRDPYGAPAITPPWGTLQAIDLNKGEILWKVPLGEYPELAAKGIKNTGTTNFGGPITTAGGIVFIAATADEKIRAFETQTGEILWEYQLPAGGYSIPSTYMIDGKQYLVTTAGGGGKNATKSGDAVIAFGLPEESSGNESTAKNSEWIELFDGKSLEGWVHLNGYHEYSVENGAIVGRTIEGSNNSFLCSKQEFGDFELVLEVMVDSITNSGIQFRSSAKPLKHGNHYNESAGRVYGPQAEIRINHGDAMLTSEGYSPTTGVIYGEALGTGWLSSEELLKNGHPHYKSNEWNELRILAKGPRIQTWVNGHQVEDLVNEEVFENHPKGFIGLQVHGIDEKGPFEMKFRNIKIRSIYQE